MMLSKESVYTVAGVVLVSLVVAWALPLPSARDVEDEAQDGFAASSFDDLIEEDLSAFVSSGRWGRSLASVIEAGTDTVDSASISGQAGYVGLISARGDNRILMTMADGAVVDIEPGNRLPDGRLLVSVSGNEAVLENESGILETLTLFPEVSNDYGNVEE